MKARPKPVPEGHHGVTPYLAVLGAARALELHGRASGDATGG